MPIPACTDQKRSALREHVPPPSRGKTTENLAGRGPPHPSSPSGTTSYADCADAPELPPPFERQHRNHQARIAASRWLNRRHDRTHNGTHDAPKRARPNAPQHARPHHRASHALAIARATNSGLAAGMGPACPFTRFRCGLSKTRARFGSPSVKRVLSHTRTRHRDPKRPEPQGATRREVGSPRRDHRRPTLVASRRFETARSTPIADTHGYSDATRYGQGRDPWDKRSG